MRPVCFSVSEQPARKISGATALPEQNRYKKVWAFPLYSIYRIYYIIDADRRSPVRLWPEENTQ